MSTFVSRQRLYLEKRDGKIAELKKLSIRQTEEFRTILTEINNEIEKEEYKELTISKAYLESTLFAHLIDGLFDLLGLKVNDFDGEQLMSLLFPHYLEDGGYSRQGILPRFILGELTGGTDVPAEAVNHYAKLLGELWASLKSFSEVGAAVEGLDYETLIEALKYKAEALKPAEQKEQEAAMISAKAEFEKLKANKDIKFTEIDDLEGVI